MQVMGATALCSIKHDIPLENLISGLTVFWVSEPCITSILIRSFIATTIVLVHSGAKQCKSALRFMVIHSPHTSGKGCTKYMKCKGKKQGKVIAMFMHRCKNLRLLIVYWIHKIVLIK